jgi:outer membrane receptor protein involved in Fe transport
MGGSVAVFANGPDSTLRLSADIAPRPVTEALAAFGRQTGLQLIYVSTIAEAQQSKGARAGLTASDALTQLLDGTGLAFEFLNARTVRIFPAPVVVPTLSAALPAPRNTERGGSSRVLGLDEVVVTATRGEEPLIRVPMDIKVWTQEAMQVSDIKGMAQLGALTPGVGYAFSPGLADAYTHLDIRGVTNQWGATTGVYLDDTPIPPARAATYLLSFPPTFDLERVEILAGPQTVLLGDHTQAGAIRFIPTQPSLTTSTGLFRAEWDTTEYGGPSYEAGAAVGGPLATDVLGFRLTGWYREDGGYVDRVDSATGVTLDADANRYFSKLVRGALTFAPTAAVQVTPSLTYQSIRIRDTSTFDSALSDPGSGVFKNPSPVQQPFEEAYYLASVKLTARLRAGDLSAVAAYFEQTGSTTAWTQFAFLGTTSGYFGLQQRAYSADVRLSSHDPDAALTWTTGVFFTGEHAHHPYWPDGVYSDTAVTDQGRLEGFGQIAGKLTQRLTATAGIRVGHANLHYSDNVLPPVQGETPDTWYAPRFGLSWQADEADLVYLTVAKGYGSPVFIPVNTGPASGASDALWSYEIGSKHELLNGRLHLEATVFHIEWDNGPPNPSFAGGEHTPVPGRAVSNGFGLTLQALVTQQTRLALDVAYSDARVTQTSTLDGQLWVRAGASLPVSPWHVTASIERDFPIRSGLTASLRVEDVYRSSPGSTYLNDPESVPLFISTRIDPSVNVLNVRAALKWPSFEAAAFVRNALNSHPLVTGLANGVDNPSTNSTQVVTLVPRTLGVSSTWRF